MKNKWILKGYPWLFTIILFFTACEVEDLNLGSNDDRDKITDTWNCNEESSLFGKTSYDSDISKSSSDSVTIYIDNIYQLGFATEANATLDNRKIIIPQQQVEGNIIEGNGQVSSNYQSIEFNYIVDDGSGDIDNVYALYTRK